MTAAERADAVDTVQAWQDEAVRVQVLRNALAVIAAGYDDGDPIHAFAAREIARLALAAIGE